MGCLSVKFYCIKFAARIIAAQGDGAMVVIRSVRGSRPYPDASAYNVRRKSSHHSYGRLLGAGAHSTAYAH